MTKHLCIPIKHWWRRKYLCVHCDQTGSQATLFDREGCDYSPIDAQHDKAKCRETPCACQCAFCLKFPQ